MKTLVNSVAAVLLAGLPIALFSQWPNYPTPGVPRTPDGKPNLEGPAPRTADGKPDLSGIWASRGQGGQGKNKGKAPALAPGEIPNATFGNVGAGVPEGLPLRPLAAEVMNRRRADNSKDNPDAHCLPIGLTQLHLHPQPRKIVQTPAVVVIMYESNSGLRQIFTDGRPLPNNDPQPWWYGYSVGKWEGDTLVVETIGFRDDVWLDVRGSPLTNAGKMIERMRRPNYGTLETEITIDDPTAYTKPFTVKVTHRVMLDTDLIEFVCAENERFVPHIFGSKGGK